MANWETVERPGFLAKGRDDQYREWNKKFGTGKWRIAWQLADGTLLQYPGIFYQGFVAGYVNFFQQFRGDLEHITTYYSYTYDKDDPGNKADAFNPYFFYNKEGSVNQIHHAALNIAAEIFLGVVFKGNEPLKVRGVKEGTPISEWPRGHIWHPGRIPAVRPDLIPAVETSSKWGWEEGSIEELYQKSKVLQVKT